MEKFLTHWPVPASGARLCYLPAAYPGVAVNVTGLFFV